MDNADSKILDSVLLLQEAPLHPNSVMTRLEERFEKPSIVHVVRRDGLRGYTKAPIYDEKYLVIFEDVKVFSSNLGYLKLNIMTPIVVCTNRSMLEEAKAICVDKSLKYRVYVNRFEKDDAYALINNLATEAVSKTFCDTLIARVGLNPQRIISAITVCEQVGYKVSNISRYIDKYVYIDVYDVIESLLKICKSKAQIQRAALYIHMNRLWYKRYTRNLLITEVSFLIRVYRDLIDGKLTAYSMQEYLETEHLPRYKVMYAIDLFEHVSLNRLLVLEQFLSTASILEVVMQLS